MKHSRKAPPAQAPVATPEEERRRKASEILRIRLERLRMSSSPEPRA